MYSFIGAPSHFPRLAPTEVMLCQLACRGNYGDEAGVTTRRRFPPPWTNCDPKRTRADERTSGRGTAGPHHTRN